MVPITLNPKKFFDLFEYRILSAPQDQRFQVMFKFPQEDGHSGSFSPPETWLRSPVTYASRLDSAALQRRQEVSRLCTCFSLSHWRLRSPLPDMAVRFLKC